MEAPPQSLSIPYTRMVQLHCTDYTSCTHSPAWEPDPNNTGTGHQLSHQCQRRLPGRGPGKQLPAGGSVPLAERDHRRGCTVSCGRSPGQRELVQLNNSMLAANWLAALCHALAMFSLILSNKIITIIIIKQDANNY